MAYRRRERRRHRGLVPRCSYIRLEFRIYPFDISGELAAKSSCKHGLTWWFKLQAVTHALFDLASNPEYLKPLREEVEEVTNREGWTKAALDQMCKVDSFVKESQRFRPVSVCKSVFVSKSRFLLCFFKC